MKLNNRIEARLSEEEKNLITRTAKRLNLSTGRFIILSALKNAREFSERTDSKTEGIEENQR